MVRYKEEIYNNFTITFRKDTWGWVIAKATAYKNKNTKKQEYAILVTDGFKTKKEALNDIKKEIDKKRYVFRSSGLQQASWLK